MTAITASEAARRAGVAYPTIMRAIFRRRLKAQKVATVWVVDPESLHRYIEAMREWKGRGIKEDL